MKESILKAAAVTAVILVFGVLIGLQVDDVREGYVENQLRESTLSTQSLIVTREYLDESSRNYCKVVQDRIPEISDQNTQIGQDLQSFAGKSISNNEDYKQLRREYYVSQLRLYNLLKDYKQRCGEEATLIMFFFDDSAASTRQGSALTKYYREANNNSHIFSFNLDTGDSEVLNVLRSDYNVEGGPTVVVNGNQTFRQYNSFRELRSSIDVNKSVS